MGSSGSKGKGLSCASSSNSSSSKVRKGWSKAHRVFQSSCLSTPSGSYDSNDDNREKEKEGDVSFNQTQTTGEQKKVDGFRRVKVERSAEIPYLSSNIAVDEWDQGGLTDAATRTGILSAQASSTQSLNPSSRFLSRFRFIPGNVSFRLTRATSLGSSTPYPVSSSSLPMLDNEDERHLQAEHVRHLISREQTREGSDMLLSSHDGTPTSCDVDNTDDYRLNTRAFEISDCIPYDETAAPSHYGATNVDRTEARALDRGTSVDNTRVRTGINVFSPIISIGSENAESTLSDRQGVSREPVDRNFRFSRTLSVGRLRDRVLRRSSLSDSTLCPFQQEGEDREGSQNSGREEMNVERRASVPESSVVTTSSITPSYHPPSLSNSLFSIQDYGVQSTRPRESRYYDLLEHRSNFLERRRRIRSQVRALQRLGSRFENLSGHERSCVLSGQHSSGPCTCRTNNRNSNSNSNSNSNLNSNDNTSARASISRIVLLAEALFEVLDEIHQQSVVLSSRPSVSPIGSIPAPNEIVDSLPVKLYSKLQKHHNEEVTQCYICLVDYEEGDSMRILPCHHEFHKTCIDKWLKEIQRVCPLCRGDICRSETTADS